MKYSHLDIDEREQILVMKSLGFSFRYISLVEEYYEWLLARVRVSADISSYGEKALLATSSTTDGKPNFICSLNDEDQRNFLTTLEFINSSYDPNVISLKKPEN